MARQDSQARTGWSRCRPESAAVAVSPSAAQSLSSVAHPGKIGRHGASPRIAAYPPSSARARSSRARKLPMMEAGRHVLQHSRGGKAGAVRSAHHQRRFFPYSTLLVVCRPIMDRPDRLRGGKCSIAKKENLSRRARQGDRENASGRMIGDSRLSGASVQESSSPWGDGAAAAIRCHPVGLDRAAAAPWNIQTALIATRPD